MRTHLRRYDHTDLWPVSGGSATPGALPQAFMRTHLRRYDHTDLWPVSGGSATPGALPQAFMRTHLRCYDHTDLWPVPWGVAPGFYEDAPSVLRSHGPLARFRWLRHPWDIAPLALDMGLLRRFLPGRQRGSTGGLLQWWDRFVRSPVTGFGRRIRQVPNRVFFGARTSCRHRSKDNSRA
jgi:hypothetical protein